MTKILLALLILANFLVRFSVLPHFSAFWGMFDTGIIIIICFGLVQGEVRGALFGFISGLVYDMLLASLFGLFALLGFVAGYASGKFQKNENERSLLGTTLVALGIVFIYQAASLVGQLLFLGEVGLMRRLFIVILPKTVLTTALFVPIYVFVSFARNKVKRVEAS